MPSNTQHWFQLTTDGFTLVIPPAVQYYFGYRINYATLVKIYRSPREGEQRYLDLPPNLRQTVKTQNSSKGENFESWDCHAGSSRKSSN